MSKRCSHKYLSWTEGSYSSGFFSGCTWMALSELKFAGKCILDVCFKFQFVSIFPQLQPNFINFTTSPFPCSNQHFQVFISGVNQTIPLQFQISFVYYFIFRFSSLIKDSLWGNISFLDDSTFTSLIECSIYYCGEAEPEPVIYSNLVLQGSSLEQACKYKIVGKLWNARYSCKQFYIFSVRGRTYVCECILLLLAFCVHIAVCTARR